MDLEEAAELDNGQMIQGAGLGIAGENLGSNMIGGFTENFSAGKYFCRYCVIDRDTSHEPSLSCCS